MPSTFHPATVAKSFLIVVGLTAGLYFLYLARSTIGLLVIAGFVALALGPPVDFFVHKLRMPRWAAILEVYLVGLLLLVALGLVIVPPVVDGVQSLSADLPGEIDQLRSAGWVQNLDDEYQIVESLQNEVRSLPDRLGGAAGALKSVTVGAFSAAVQLLTVMVVAFLLLLDGPRMMNWVFRQLGESREARYREVGAQIYSGISGYVAGNLMISVVAGSITYISLIALDIPFAAPLAILMAFLDLIPLIGAAVGGILVLFATFLGDIPKDPLIWAVIFLVYQQVENNLLQPVVYKRTVDVHPIVVITAVLVGAGLLGILGALLAIPAAAAIQVIVKDWWILRRNGSLTAVANTAIAAGADPNPA